MKVWFCKKSLRFCECSLKIGFCVQFREKESCFREKCFRFSSAVCSWWWKYLLIWCLCVKFWCKSIIFIRVYIVLNVVFTFAKKCKMFCSLCIWFWFLCVGPSFRKCICFDFVHTQTQFEVTTRSSTRLQIKQILFAVLTCKQVSQNFLPVVTECRFFVYTVQVITCPTGLCT